jgi:uncharacterized protein YjbI with pentapeptide repeats
MWGQILPLVLTLVFAAAVLVLTLVVFQLTRINAIEYVSTHGLQGANLDGARFSEASFRLASFDKADLSGALFWDADFQHATLRGARMSGAELYGVDFTGARWGEDTIWPEGIGPIEKEVIS